VLVLLLSPYSQKNCCIHSPNAKNKLRFFNWLGKPTKEKGLRPWLLQKFGEAPVLYDPLLVNRTERLFEKYLQDKGYFEATVKSDTIVKNQKLSVVYQLTSKGRHSIRAIHLPSDSTEIGRLVVTNQKKTELVADKPYELANLDKERLRLATTAANQGFLNFNEKNLYFLVDTTVGPLLADIFVQIKRPSDSTRHHVYSINETYVFPDYSLENAIQSGVDSIQPKEGFTIIQHTPILRPAVLARIINQNKQDWFSKKLQDATYNRLLDLDLMSLS